MALKRWGNVQTGPTGNSMDALFSRYPKADELWISSGMDGDHGSGSHHSGSTYQGSPTAALDIVGNAPNEGLTDESKRRMRDFARWVYDTFGDLMVELIHTTPYPDDDGFYVKNQVKYPGGGPYGNPSNPDSTAGMHANHVHGAMSAALVAAANARLDAVTPPPQPEPVPPQPEPAAHHLFIDVSNHDRSRKGGPLDWHAIADAGVPGVMMAKACEGDPAADSWYHDPWFDEHQQGAAVSGFTVRGGYHVVTQATDDETILRQINALRARLDAQGCTWAMADAEAFDYMKAAGTVPDWGTLVRFNDLWLTVDQRVLAWYVPQWMWRDYLGQPDLTRLTSGPLVASNYPDVKGTTPEAFYGLVDGNEGVGWAGYGGRAPDLWQFGSDAVVAGASERTDINAYRGTFASLSALLAPRVPVPPDPEPEPEPEPPVDADVAEAAYVAYATGWRVAALLDMADPCVIPAFAYGDRTWPEMTEPNALAQAIKALAGPVEISPESVSAVAAATAGQLHNDPEGDGLGT